MTQRTVHTFLNDDVSASAGAGDIHRTDYRFDHGGLERTLTGTLTSGAEVNVYLHFYDTSASVVHLETTISAGSSSYTAATTSFVEVYTGPFQGIEVRKAGASGTATVLGIM